MSTQGYFSPTFGFLELNLVRQKILEFKQARPRQKYIFLIGTDSQPKDGKFVDFITAIVVYRVGRGGIYFWKKKVTGNHLALNKRIYQEAIFSLAAAEEFLDLVRADGITKFDVEIHLDIGEKGPSNKLISELSGMIRSCGYEVRIKPDSCAASKVADKYT